MAEVPVPGARVVATAAEVAVAWARLAAGVQPWVDAGGCVLVGVMLGGAIPLVRLAERLRGDFVLDYCHLTRYGGDTVGGELAWVQAPRQPLAGRTVVLVDDILDEGHTLAEARRWCLAAGAAAVRIVVLARKRHGRARPGLEPDLAGIEVGDEYVFGCGMDYRERWRHLDAVWALAPAAAGNG
jgi:hypoxanthine phosphoribosyltransferase